MGLSGIMMQTFASAQQRISYVDPDTFTEPDMIAEMDRCARDGTPRPESQAIRAHCPEIFRSFAAYLESSIC